MQNPGTLKYCRRDSFAHGHGGRGGRGEVPVVHVPEGILDFGVEISTEAVAEMLGLKKNKDPEEAHRHVKRKGSRPMKKIIKSLNNSSNPKD